MRRLLTPIAALLISQALLLVGHGIQLTLLPLRAEIEGFTSPQVALTGSTYFIGFVLGCLLAPKLVRRVGHIRSFAVLTSLFSATVLVIQAFPNFEAWLALRFVVGSCISGLYMVIENWLNDRSTRETRGTILSVYTILNLTMLVAGQQLINFGEPSGSGLFILAAILLSLAIIPVSVTLALAPAPVQPVPFNIRRLWQISHAAILGVIATGLVTGAFWSLGPVFLRGIGMTTTELTFFMSAVVLGGAVFQLPLGRLSDRFDRRLILLFAAIVAAILSVLIVAFAQQAQVLWILAALWGGVVMPQYSICLAHAADNAEPQEFVMVGSSILLLFGLSSAIGGPASSLFMAIFGPLGLFVYMAACLSVLSVLIVIRRRQHELPPVLEEAEPFRAAGAEVSPAVFALDPRTEDHDWENRHPEAENPFLEESAGKNGDADRVDGRGFPPDGSA